MEKRLEIKRKEIKVLRCIKCGKEYIYDSVSRRCLECGGTLEAKAV
jgi:rRNA maturation endonuclease Nob1